MKKYVIFVHAGETELARALHALLYAQEIHESGHEVKVIFDGAGTVWVKQFEDEGNKYHQVYKAVKSLGVIEGVCDYCAGAFGVKEELQKSNTKFVGERNGHPSLSQFIENDYQIITL